MKCLNCGAELNEGDRFCQYCGKEVYLEQLSLLRQLQENPLAHILRLPGIEGIARRQAVDIVPPAVKYIQNIHRPASSFFASTDKTIEGTVWSQEIRK